MKLRFRNQSSSSVHSFCLEGHMENGNSTCLWERELRVQWLGDTHSSMCIVYFLYHEHVILSKYEIWRFSAKASLGKYSLTQIFLLGGFLVAQWLKSLPANSENMGSISGLGRSHMPQSN